jgi:hypothetical protein
MTTTTSSPSTVIWPEPPDRPTESGAHAPGRTQARRTATGTRTVTFEAARE